MAQAAPKPPKQSLQLVIASDTLTLTHRPKQGVFLNLGTHLTAVGGPFELQVRRSSYSKPVEVVRVIHEGGKTRKVTLPKGLVKNFDGLTKFLHVTITDSTGKKVVEQDQNVCPAGEGQRTKPGGTTESPYPQYCSGMPFTLGNVWGIQKDWAVEAYGYQDRLTKLADGQYTATVTVNKTYQKLFGTSSAAKKLTLHVKTADGPGHGDAAHNLHHAKKPGVVAKPAAHRPTGPNKVPAGPKPDLRSLPAFGIRINHGEDGGPGGMAKKAPVMDYLSFSATVWNAGPSKMVVDGFRAKPDLMDAYQYFYDLKGKEVGHAKTGQMEWDPRKGHEHWHFKDFASYRLLKADQQEIVRSQKEAFCLANTDAIDLLVKGANWLPSNTDLHSSCGQQSSLSVREVLDVGSGDTYSQYLPGQSFDITQLPNGTYYIQVIANPEHRLFESNVKNNVALRKVILGGTPGHRTVKVPPVGLVDAP